MQPVLVVLLASGAAVAAAALGVLPFVHAAGVPRRWLGWSNAAAAGAMLGAAYLLAAARIDGVAPALGAGALLGIMFVWWSHRVSGTEDLERARLDDRTAAYGYDVLLVSALHSGAEGVAIGAAMAVDPGLGLGVAAAMALHNIPEATVLAAVFRARGDSVARATLLAVVGNAPQVPMAVSAFAVLEAAPALLPAALGFAAGALIYLVTVDLLPESYRQAGATSIALVALLAMGVVAGLQGMVP
jgi:zinc transporter ZupT